MQIGGGILVAAGLFGGVVIGSMFGQSSVGLVVGLVLGLAAALLVGWWANRGRG